MGRARARGAGARRGPGAGAGAVPGPEEWLTRGNLTPSQSPPRPRAVLQPRRPTAHRHRPGNPQHRRHRGPPASPCHAGPLLGFFRHDPSAAPAGPGLGGGRRGSPWRRRAGGGTGGPAVVGERFPAPRHRGVPRGHRRRPCAVPRRAVWKGKRPRWRHRAVWKGRQGGRPGSNSSSPARHGVAWRGLACHSVSRHPGAVRGTARHRLARCSTAWHRASVYGTTWCSTAWRRASDHGTPRHGAAWRGDPLPPRVPQDLGAGC